MKAEIQEPDQIRFSTSENLNRPAGPKKMQNPDQKKQQIREGGKEPLQVRGKER